LKLNEKADSTYYFGGTKSQKLLMTLLLQWFLQYFYHFGTI